MKIQNLNRNQLNSVISNVSVAQDISQKIEFDNQLIQNHGGECEGFIYHIVIKDSEIIGYCLTRGSLHDGSRQIQIIYISELYRRQGVAKLLLMEISKNAIATKHKRIRAEICETTDEQKGLHRLFLKLKNHYENQIELAWIFSNEEFGKYRHRDFQL